MWWWGRGWADDEHGAALGVGGGLEDGQLDAVIVEARHLAQGCVLAEAEADGVGVASGDDVLLVNPQVGALGDGVTIGSLTPGAGDGLATDQAAHVVGVHGQMELDLADSLQEQARKHKESAGG